VVKIKKTNSRDASSLHQTGGTAAWPLADRAELPAGRIATENNGLGISRPSQTVGN